VRCAAATRSPAWAGTSSPCCSTTAATRWPPRPEALTAPFVLAGHSLDVRASIGVCALQPADPPVDVDVLLARSDAAMYRAKNNGKARVVSYDGDAADLLRWEFLAG
jgi:predicted signal transduction protein with EAL and GGDEF domain